MPTKRWCRYVLGSFRWGLTAPGFMPCCRDLIDAFQRPTSRTVELPGAEVVLPQRGKPHHMFLLFAGAGNGGGDGVGDIHTNLNVHLDGKMIAQQVHTLTAAQREQDASAVRAGVKMVAPRCWKGLVGCHDTDRFFLARSSPVTATLIAVSVAGFPWTDPPRWVSTSGTAADGCDCVAVTVPSIFSTRPIRVDTSKGNRRHGPSTTIKAVAIRAG